jgi:glycosyltransferase involved in cell wall biosynthesis
MISIIIATYNVAETLQNCLDSIFNQDNKHLIKTIIIDGDSKDGTVSILKKNDQLIDFWISEKDNGIYDAMSKGLKKVNTPWVYFLGADDELLPDFSKLISELQNPKKIYYSNVIYKGAKHSGKVSSYHQAKLGIFHQSIIYPTSVFKKYQYNTRYKIAADYALNMQLHKDTQFHFDFKDYTIAKYNDSGISSKVIDTAFEADKLQLIYNNFGFDTLLRYTFREMKQYFKKILHG